MKQFQRLYLSGLFIIPFVFWPWASVAYEIPRVWFFCRWVELLVLIAIVGVIPPKKIDNKVFLIILCFILWSVAASVFGADFAKSVIGNFYRKDGLITLIHLALFAYITSCFVTVETIKKIPFVVAIASVASSFLIVVLNFFYYVLGINWIPNFFGVIGGTFGQPNFLAGYLLVSLPFVWHIRQIKRSVFWKLGLIVQILVIISTRSWAGVLGILLFLLYKLFNQHEKAKYIRLILFALTSALILFGSYFYFLHYRKMQSRPQDGLIAESRERIYYKGFQGFLKRPVLGWGWANFDYAFESVDWPLKIENDVYVDKAHSHLLESLVTTGVMGFVLYVLIILIGFNNILKLPDRDMKQILFAGYILFIFHSQTNVISISEELFFWLVLGIGARVSTQNDN